MKKISLIITLAIIMCFGSAISYAQAPSELESSDVVAKQLIDTEGVGSPYVALGEAVVGLVKQMVDLEEDSGSSIVFHRATGKLFVKTTPKNHDMIRDVLKNLRDYMPRQLMIEARIIEVGSFEGVDIGIDWDSFQKRTSDAKHTMSGSMDFGAEGWGTTTLNPLSELNLTYGYLNGFTQINATLRALEQENKINTLSSPRIFCLNNQRANFKIEETTDYVSKVETNTVYSGDNVDVHTNTDVDTAVEGIVLDVIPSINTDNETITLQLHPTVVDLVSLTEVTLSSNETIKVPKYVKRTANTTVCVDDGGTVVIGGLMKRTDKTDVRKIPILGDIPIIKNLFRAETKYEDKSNLMIFITAKIRDEE